MKKTLTISALALGFLAGASALSVLADTGGTWTAPSAAAPAGNVAAPVNVSSATQQKNGWLGLIGLVTANLTIASGTPAAGNVLISDASGNASWQSPTVIPPGDNCVLVGATDAAHQKVAVNVPDLCTNNNCGLLMMVFNSSNLVDSVTSASIIQVANSARSNKGAAAYWWSKTGAGHDGTDCAAGRNGTTEGCDRLLGSGRNDIYLQDDNSGIEMNQNQWSLTDQNSGFPVTQVWACN